MAAGQQRAHNLTRHNHPTCGKNAPRPGAGRDESCPLHAASRLSSGSAAGLSLGKLTQGLCQEWCCTLAAKQQARGVLLIREEGAQACVGADSLWGVGWAAGMSSFHREPGVGTLPLQGGLEVSQRQAVHKSREPHDGHGGKGGEWPGRCRYAGAQICRRGLRQVLGFRV